VGNLPHIKTHHERFVDNGNRTHALERMIKHCQRDIITCSVEAAKYKAAALEDGCNVGSFIEICDSNSPKAGIDSPLHRFLQ
jgi:hypothetical protein